MHEAIHAYFLSLVDLQYVDESYAIELQTDFPLLWNYYNERIGSDEEGVHHEEMAMNYINTISNALKELFGTRFDEQFYNDIAWGSLTGTDAFSMLDPAERNRIISVNDIEDENKSGAKGSLCE